MGRGREEGGHGGGGREEGGHGGRREEALLPLVPSGCAPCGMPGPRPPWTAAFLLRGFVNGSNDQHLEGCFPVWPALPGRRGMTEAAGRNSGCEREGGLFYDPPGVRVASLGEAATRLTP